MTLGPIDEAWRGTFERGEAFLAERNIADAVRCFDRSQQLGANPNECSGRRWLAYMLSGRFENAWRESDFIRSSGFPDPHRFWDGTDLSEKRVVLRCLHGFGDAVQFLRYVPRLLELTAALTVEVSPRLMPLAHYLCGGARIVQWGDQKAQSDFAWDAQVEVTELPYLFRTELADLPLAVKYLRLPEQRVKEVDLLLGDRTKARVGLVHTAGEWNTSRSIDPALFSSLPTASCKFYSLDCGESAIGSRYPSSTFEIVRIPKLIEGIADLATVIANLDLVITVDTMAAHLAGAMGCPCWVLLQYAADWRWLLKREDSPWYPSVRLFRQPRQGDWAAVMSNVSTALTAWTNEPSL